MIMIRIIIISASILLPASVSYAAVPVPGYRSGVFQKDKPILRIGGSNEDEYESEEPKIVKSNDAGVWIQHAQEAIENLQKDLGVERAQPFIDKLIEDAKNYFHIRMNVQGKTNLTLEKIPTNIDAKKAKYEQLKLRVYSKEYQEDIEESDQPVIRAQHNTPTWLVDLKSYVRYLVDRYSKKNKLVKQLKPIIKSVEKTNGVVIDDIDVDQFGDVLIRFSTKTDR